MQVFGLIFLLLALGGCSLELDRVKEENETLKQKVSQLEQSNFEAHEKIKHDFAARMSQFEKMEHLAGVSQACRVIFNICPATMTAPGDEAIKNGASGALTATYWTVLFLKACFLLCVIFSVVAFWSWRLRPDLSANSRAQQELYATKEALQKLLHRQSEIERAQAASERKKNEAEERLSEIEYEISEAILDLDIAKKQLAEIEKSAKQKEATIKALGSFKL